MNSTPVIIGIAHVEQRITDLSDAQEPLDLMLTATKEAAKDAQISLEDTSSVRVVRGIWPYENPAQVIAEALDLKNPQTMLTPFGG